jgi:hypothetical protein
MDITMSSTANESMYEDNEIAADRPFSPPSSKQRAPGYSVSTAAWRSPPRNTFTFDSIGDANVRSFCACESWYYHFSFLSCSTIL